MQNNNATRSRQCFVLSQLFLWLLSGCAAIDAIGDKDSIRIVKRNGLDIHSTSPGHSLVVTRDNGSTEKYCAGRPPDLVDDKSFAVNLPVPGKNLQMGTGSNELSLGGRSPDVLIVREVLYRFCELSINQNLSSAETVGVFRELYPLILKALSSPVAGVAAKSSVDAAQVTPSADKSANPSADPNQSSSSSFSSPYGPAPK